MQSDILNLLEKKPFTTSELREKLGISQSTLSKQLSKLREKGKIRKVTLRDNTALYYLCDEDSSEKALSRLLDYKDKVLEEMRR